MYESIMRMANFHNRNMKTDNEFIIKVKRGYHYKWSKDDEIAYYIFFDNILIYI